MCAALLAVLTLVVAALGLGCGGAPHTEFTAAGQLARVDLATAFFKADVYCYGAGSRFPLGLSACWTFRLGQDNCGCMPLRFCCCAVPGSFWVWTRGCLYQLGCGSGRSRCIFETDCIGAYSSGLLVRAGGSLAGVVLARVFFNDGVSNEGVSHVF